MHAPEHEQTQQRRGFAGNTRSHALFMTCMVPGRQGCRLCGAATPENAPVRLVKPSPMPKNSTPGRRRSAGQFII